MSNATGAADAAGGYTAPGVAAMLAKENPAVDADAANFDAMAAYEDSGGAPD